MEEEVDSQILAMRVEILGDKNDDSLDEVFAMRLNDAKYTYLRLVYPFDRTIDELPDERAKNWQLKAAIEIYNWKAAGYGNWVSYSENGLQITFAKAGLSKDLLSELPPAKAGVPIKPETETSTEENGGN